jgi:tetratricopeptide (TPR) repeat protein
MMLKKYSKIVMMLIGILMIAMMPACVKKFLDAKPDRSLAVPNSLDDLDAILNNDNILNFNTPFIQELAGDDFYIEDATLRSASIPLRNSYIWADDFYEDFSISTGEWTRNYTRVFNANVVLDKLEQIRKNVGNEREWDRIKGTALFFRAVGHFYIAQLFAEQYDGAGADLQKGIPLRLTSNVNDRPSFGTLRETYGTIIKDLKEAAEIVPISITHKKSSPDRDAVHAMLARVFLSMEDYKQAFEYANKVLNEKSCLMDFNNFNSLLPRPIPTGYFPYNTENCEILLFLSQVTYSSFNVISARNVFIHTDLYDSYDNEDLRKSYFFQHVKNNLYSFVGTYNGLVDWFSGLTTAELYLIRMECYARMGNIESALADLNFLRSHRIKKSEFVPIEINAIDELLDEILWERRRELICRGLRWSDLKRLNKDPRYAKEIVHIYDGKSYVLLPNSEKYVFPIHPVELELAHLK